MEIKPMANLTEGFPEQPDVVIIGAGPTGMILAYLLVTNGISVRVLERHPDFKREFRGEGIQPSVMAVLDELGFMPVLLEKGIAIPAQQAKIFLKAGYHTGRAGSKCR
jgi:2-polyprenyl-6-methoxyphenol hydroxylase-like FAD-dependent oxidoreductase